MAEPIEIPDEILRNLPADPQVAKNADWALKFRNTTTNFAQRARYRGDLDAYAQQLLDSKEAYEQKQLEKDAGARALYFRHAELNAKAAINKENQARAAELHAQRLKLMEQQAATSHAHEKATLATEALRARHDQRTAEDTSGFATHMEELFGRGVGFQTDEAKAGIAIGLSRFPNVKPEFVSKYGATLFPGEKLSPDEIMDKVKTLQAQNPDRSISMNAKGDVTVATSPQLASVTETTESRNTPADVNQPETTTRRTVTSKQPAAEVRQSAPMSGREFLDSLKPGGSKAPATAPNVPAAPATSSEVAAPAPAAAKTIWREHNGVRWEYDAETKKPTGRHIGK